MSDWLNRADGQPAWGVTLSAGFSASCEPEFSGGRHRLSGPSATFWDFERMALSCLPSISKPADECQLSGPLSLGLEDNRTTRGNRNPPLANDCADHDPSSSGPFEWGALPHALRAMRTIPRETLRPWGDASPRAGGRRHRRRKGDGRHTRYSRAPASAGRPCNGCTALPDRAVPALCSPSRGAQRLPSQGPCSRRARLRPPAPPHPRGATSRFRSSPGGQAAVPRDRQLPFGSVWGRSASVAASAGRAG